MGIIYGIINHKSKKSYIGSTTAYYTRIVQHFGDLRRGAHDNIHLQRSFNKWGEGAFKVHILDFATNNSILELEQAWIDTFAPEFNIAVNAKAPMAGRKHTTASKALISKNSSRHNKGLAQSFSSRLKNVISNGGSWVVCYETGEMFLGVAEVAKKLGLRRANIQSMLRGYLKTTGGLTFFRKDIV